MAEFLAPDWLAELDAAARAVTELPAELAGVRLTVEQVVRDATRGEVRYHVRIADGAIRVSPGPADAPDIRFLADYDTARRMLTGETNVQAALTTGRFKVQGRIDRLLGLDEALATLGEVFARVRDTTSFRNASR